MSTAPDRKAELENDPPEVRLRSQQTLLKNIRSIQSQDVEELQLLRSTSQSERVQELLDEIITLAESIRFQGETEYYLAVWRNALGLSQQDLADKAGVSKSDISQKEKIGVNIRQSTAEHLAKCLGITLEQLRRRPTPRDMRGGRMAKIAQSAGREAAERAKRSGLK